MSFFRSIISFQQIFNKSVVRRIGAYQERSKNYVKVVQRLLAEHRYEKTGYILDVGMGNGQILASLEDTPELVKVGLDRSRTDVQLAHNMGLEAVVADAEHLPFRKSSFLAILLLSMLEHTKTPTSCVKEVFDALVPNGICIVQIANLQWFIEIHTMLPMLIVPKALRDSLMHKSESIIGSRDINFDPTIKNIIHWFKNTGYDFTHSEKWWHDISFLRLLIWPPGWFFVFERHC